MMCTFCKDNDVQLTVTDLANKMKEYLTDTESVAYGKQYLVQID